MKICGECVHAAPCGLVQSCAADAAADPVAAEFRVALLCIELEKIHAGLWHDRVCRDEDTHAEQATVLVTVHVDD